MSGKGTSRTILDRKGTGPRRVAIGYHFFAHYRRAVLEELCRRGRHSYLLAGDRRSNQATIKAWDIPGDIAFRQTRCWTIKGVVIQPGLIRLALRRDIDTLVLLGVVWWPFTSAAAVLARLTGKRVLFWGHGWTMREKGALRHLRRTFYRIPHALLFYGHMAKMIALEEGFRPEDVHVIYNSLDFAAQKRESERVTREDLARLRRELFGTSEKPIVNCTTRLIALRRLDLLIRALAELKRRGRDVGLLLVGEGPERENLERLAKELGVDARFYGACYDDERLAPLLMASNVTVAPGKVGLTAMTSLGFGTPVVTHGDADHQMPEWEAIIPGRTGSFFRLDDVQDLARAIAEWTDTPWTKDEVRRDCRDIIGRFWNAPLQRRAIERAIDGLPADDLFWMKEEDPAEARDSPGAPARTVGAAVGVRA